MSELSTEYSLDAEQAVIAALLMDNASYFKVCALLQPSHFYVNAHRKIYEMVAALLAKNVKADLITLSDELEGDLTLGEIADIAKRGSSPANIAAYAEIVIDRAKKRGMRLALENALATLDDQPIDQSVTEAMFALQNLSHANSEDIDFASALDMAQEAAEKAQERRRHGAVLGCSTTFPTLDRLTGGLHGPKMVVLGGRPGTYKSAIAWQILMQAAAKGVPVGMISLEMGASELAGRAVANILKVNGHDYASGWHVAVDQARERMTPAMKAWPIRIDSTSTRLGEIVARIVEWKFRYNIQIACVDHIQLIHHDKAQNRFQEISEVSRQMKLLAMRLDIPILVLSQLSRDVEKEHRQPVNSDMRESGNIEQDADCIIFSHCVKGKGAEKDRFELILSKQRGGVARKVIDVVATGEFFHVGEAVETARPMRYDAAFAEGGG